MDMEMIFSLIFLFFLPYLALASQLRHSLANKRFIDQLKEGSYEIVHPFQMREKSRDRVGIDTRELFLNSTPAQHFRQVNFVVRSSVLAHQRLKLALSLNEHLLAAKSRLREMRPGVGGVRNEEGTIENCFYQGSVSGEPGSLVAMSTCEGLWGLLAFANGTALGIWPLEGGDRGRRHPHVLFWVDMAPPGKCGTKQTVVEDGHRQRRRMRGLGEAGHGKGTRLFLELALLIDQAMMRHFNLTTAKAVEYSLNSLNLADLLLRRGLDLRLSASLLELWTDSVERIEPRLDGQQTLGSLLDYVTGQLFGEEKDTTLLMTGQPLATGETMAAVPGGACTSRAIGLVQVPNPFGAHQTGLAIAHSIGHILGMDHDSEECGCGEQQNCLMSARLGPGFPLHFSACSSARLLTQLGRPWPQLQCLFNRPFHSSARLSLCGNGLLDPGEECDCGRRDQCQDPCCDPHICQLRPHAQCAAHQPCCHRCQFRLAGHPCRSSRSVCDVPESCDGLGGDCPADGYLLDGTQCGLGGNGQCWQGNCADGDGQCRELWGKDARIADSLCFGQNRRALEYGHCGRDREGSFVECAPENERCGLLQCREGMASPSFANATSFSLQFAQGSSKPVQCKVVANFLVNDGTNCGQGRVCVRSVCLPLAQVSPPIQCPSNNLALQCSGHGDCTSTRQCLCFDAWTGQACDVRSFSSRRPEKSSSENGRELPELIPLAPNSRFEGKALETATLLAILLLVGLLLLLLLICLLLFYRRKISTDPFRRANGNQMKAVDEEEGEDEGTSGRAIKFGQMPSWREEKRKRKTNKRVYDALQRITEANEVDSLSLKSRESSIVANTSVHPPLENHFRPASANAVAITSFPSPPPVSNRHSPLFTRGGIFVGQKHEGHEEMATNARGEHLGQAMANGVPHPQAQFGPRLANISLLMRKLDETIGAGVEGEQQQQLAIGSVLVLPSDSTDSGNTGSNLDIRESPSLFSDPYRLDLPS